MQETVGRGREREARARLVLLRTRRAIVQQVELHSPRTQLSSAAEHVSKSDSDNGHVLVVQCSAARRARLALHDKVEIVEDKREQVLGHMADRQPPERRRPHGGRTSLNLLRGDFQLTITVR